MKHSDFLWEGANTKFLVRSTYEVNNERVSNEEFRFGSLSCNGVLATWFAVHGCTIQIGYLQNTVPGPVYRHFLK